MDISPVNVAFITDKNYSLCTGVAVCSLKAHRSLDRQYKIYVVYDGLDQQCMQQIRSLSEPDFTVIFVNAREKVKAVKINPQKCMTPHVSPTATYKFNLTRILPDIDKLLYIDGDTIIRDNLVGLFDIDISNKYAAVCQDIGAETLPSDYKIRLKINHRYYFNSGVMLLNLKKIREKQLDLKLLEYRKHGRNDYMDQDAFNVVFCENVLYFDIVYNMSTSCWTKYRVDKINSYYNKTFHSKADCYTQARILHLTTPEKPWLYSDVIGSEEWLIYYLRSPMYSPDFVRKRIGISKYKNLIKSEMDYCSAVSRISTIPKKKSPEEPLVSVIIPFYNSEQYLGECIESLLLQTFMEGEYIFVDDGSSDESAKIVRMFMSIDSRIRLYCQTHSGPGNARNLGLKHVRGKYITFLDSDDIFISNALKELYSKILLTGSDVVICDCLAFSENKTATWAYESSLKRIYLPVNEIFSSKKYPDYLFQITDGQVWGKMFRRDMILENAILFPSLQRSEDIPFSYLALVLADRISILKNQLVLHRVIAGSSSLEESKDNNATAVDSALRILWGELVALGRDTDLYKTFINKAIASYYYNFTTMKTSNGFESLYMSFKETVNNTFEVPFEKEDMFYESYKKDYLEELCNSDSIQEYLFELLKKANNNNDLITARSDDFDIKSYQLGRFLTWLPRKVLGGIRCYRDNGLKYTVNRFFEHVSGKA